MIIDFGMNWENFYTDNIVGYIKSIGKIFIQTI